MTAGRALRIALIASSFAPHIGGVETHVARVATGLQSRGHRVEVWTVDRGIRTARSFPTPVHYLPAPLPARSLDGVYRMLWSMPQAWRSWQRVHRDLRPDVLSVQCFGPNGIYASRLHRALGTPLVVSSHGETLGDDGGAYRSSLLRRNLRRAIGDADAVTAPSNYVLDDLRARFGLSTEAGKIVANGVDLDSGVHSPEVQREPLLVAVGRLGRMKGFDLLIDAFARARLEGVRLEIIGDGPERGRLQQQISDAGLGNRVTLTGAKDSTAVAERIGAASVVVVPSRSESFGIVALEAWRGGAALVMTGRGGAVDFIRDGEDAIIVDPEDVPALAAALRAIVTDASRRRDLARHGAERVKEFGWERIVDDYETLFQQL